MERFERANTNLSHYSYHALVKANNPLQSPYMVLCLRNCLLIPILLPVSIIPVLSCSTRQCVKPSYPTSSLPSFPFTQ